jgi:sugar phosphate isomerase/epimerase
VVVLAETGYRSVAITLDHHVLNPFGPNLEAEIAAARSLLARYGMRSVVETGARFLLDPRQKHEPTLMSAAVDARAVRVGFLRRAIDVAAALGSDAVSFWSGRLREPLDRKAALARLVEGCQPVLDHAARRNVKLAFEPEPGMFIETMEQYAELAERLSGPHFGLTLDIGHLHCVELEPIAEHVIRWGEQLCNVHIEDMRHGVHEHLMFGEGEIDFPPVLATLETIGYRGGVHVELSRHSHMAPEAAAAAYRFLTEIVDRNHG